MAYMTEENGVTVKLAVTVAASAVSVTKSAEGVG